jgi:MPBQ/MSBQ methyltransferase
MKSSIIGRYDSLMYTPGFREFFDGTDYANFGYWDATTATQRQASERLMEKLLEFIPDRSGAVLDVACGKGATTHYLTRYWPPERITGINISAKQLATCRVNAPGCSFLEMDAARLTFDDASFDSVICVEAAFHFDTREDFLQQALRVLKPGGWLSLCDVLMREEAEQTRPYRNPRNFVRDPDAYLEMLRRVGFREARVVDATEACWHGCYRHAVRYFHEQYLQQIIDLQTLRSALETTYRRVGDLSYYILAGGRK